MFSEFHFIRPYWLLALLPLLPFAWQILKKHLNTNAWTEVCDPHLLPLLMQQKPRLKRQAPTLMVLMSALFMIISLSGPSWSRFPVPTYQPVQPRVLLLDLSEAMLEDDLKPNRLNRAKFKLHDLLAQRHAGQFGLVVYTGEPFVVSPLTDDSQTIDALLSMLTPDIMPIGGDRLDAALKEAAKLITQAGFNDGNILVMTSRAPTTEAVDSASLLRSDGINVSIMPILGRDKPLNPLFERLASAGGGELISLTDTSDDLNQWLKATRSHRHYSADLNHKIPVWRDQGRLFIWPALLLFLPVFRHGWLQRISS